VSWTTTTRFPALPLTRYPIEEVSPDGGEIADIPDEALLASVQTGNREAFGIVFRRYARLVRCVGQRILGDDGEADDLVQEVFLYIHRKSALFDKTKGSARAWIVQVAYTQAFVRRRHLNSRRFYSSVNMDKTPGEECVVNAVADYDHSVEGLFGRNGWREILDRLTADQRETLRLHFFEGYTLLEISEKLGQSHVNVRHHYYRGLDKIRKQVSSERELGNR
jgi:RNA polymerase sigma-70 factor (ECF subfamily)